MRATIDTLRETLGGRHRDFALQIVRYGIAGVGITLFQIGVYNLLAGPARLAPLVANAVAYAAALGVGYVVHSRFSFGGHGSRGNVARTGGRFVIASLIGFATNSFWVYLFTSRLHWKDWTPSLPMFFLTPFLLFWLNRRWVFE